MLLNQIEIHGSFVQLYFFVSWVYGKTHGIPVNVLKDLDMVIFLIEDYYCKINEILKFILAYPSNELLLPFLNYKITSKFQLVFR